MALNDNIVAFWKLDEADGATRADAAGPNDLADNATVTKIAGKVGFGAHFARASNQYLSLADNVALSGSDRDISMSVWLYMDSKPVTSMDIITKFLPGTNQREYALWWDVGSDRFKFYVDPDGTAGSFTIVVANNFGAPSLNTWYNVIIWHDATANTINITVNDGTADSVSHTTGIFNGTAEFRIGARGDDVEFWDGRIDAAGFWDKVFTAQEKTDLYNGGAGLEHPFIVDVLPVIQSRISIAQP